jgi:hypothetical protein
MQDMSSCLCCTSSPLRACSATGAWVANCVGALNCRYFLGFVLSNIFMLWYGAILAVATMWGVLKDAGMLDRPVYDGSGASLHANHSDRILISWNAEFLVGCDGMLLSL